MRRRNLVALVTALIVTTVVGLFAYPRIKVFGIDDGRTGFILLVACHAGTTLYSQLGYSVDAEIVPTRSDRLDSWIACKAINYHQTLLVTDTNWQSQNKALAMLVDHAQGCNDRRLSESEVARCKQAMTDSVDWLLDNGVEINPENGCGYLRNVASMSLDVEMFSLLLSRGADPSMRCARNESPPTTVLEDLELFLSWLEDGEFPDVRAAYLEMIEMASHHLSAR